MALSAFGLVGFRHIGFFGGTVMGFVLGPFGAILKPHEILPEVELDSSRGPVSVFSQVDMCVIFCRLMLLAPILKKIFRPVEH